MTLKIQQPGGSANDATPTQLAQIRSDLGVSSVSEVTQAINTLIAAHAAAVDPHPQYLTMAEGDVRYVRTVNGQTPDGNGNVVVSSSGGPGTIDGSVIDGSGNAVSGNAVFDALALKASKSSDTLADMTLNGLTVVGGAVRTTSTNMGAGTQIDTGKVKQTKSIAAATGLTFSGTPPVGSTFGLEISNTGAGPFVVTIPSSFSMAKQALVTAFTLPANAIAYIEWYFDGAVYRMQGDPVPLSTKAIVREFPLGGNDTIVLLPYAPHGGVITAVVTDCDGAGTATYTVRINGTPIGASANAVSASQVTQTTVNANRFNGGDRLTLARSNNNACVNGRITVLYAPDAP
jgi:hypothetical protein